MLAQCFTQVRNFFDEDMGTYPQTTPFLLAVKLGRCRATRMLLAFQGPTALTIGDGFGNLPIHIAADKGNMDILCIIVTADPNQINALDDEGNLPLCHAARHKKESVTQWLLSQHERGDRPPDKDVLLKELFKAANISAYGIVENFISSPLVRPLIPTTDTCQFMEAYADPYLSVASRLAAARLIEEMMDAARL